MSSGTYLQGRRRYQRPQAMLWADNKGTIEQIDGESFYVPLGSEVGAANYSEFGNSFLVLSDDNRSEIDFSNERIENRQRMVNGRMRSYHVADKLTISVSWEMLPSRAFALPPNFSETTGETDGKSIYTGNRDLEFTTDGGAGGNELLSWYENHTGSFWAFLAYDKYTSFGREEAAYQNLAKYNQIVEVFFADFNYTVVKRGGSNYDFWNISVTLEEV